MWTTLTSVPEPGEVLNAFAIVSLIVFGAIFLAAAVYSARPGTPPFGADYSRPFIKRATAVLGWASGIGLFFLIIRLLQINPLSFGTTLWVVLSWILLLLCLVYVGLTSVADRAEQRLDRPGEPPAAAELHEPDDR